MSSMTRCAYIQKCTLNKIIRRAGYGGIYTDGEGGEKQASRMRQALLEEEIHLHT